MRKIAVLTSGGDAPGMNACIRAVVRAAITKNLEVAGVMRGYEGLIKGNFVPLKSSSVSNIIQKGGTLLKSARCTEFTEAQGRKKAHAQLQTNAIDGLIVIGGNGTFTGAKIFFEEYNFPIIGIPGTIDNDLYGTDFTLGYDTAVNTALDAIDKIRDTADSHDRVFFVEVMGRDSGYIAIPCAVGGGAEVVMIPETITTIDSVIEMLENGRNRSKTSFIIIVAEGDEEGSATQIAARVKERLPHLDARVAVIGHVQRGGSPTAADRMLGSRLGIAAVDALTNGQKNVMAGIINDQLVYTLFSDTITRKKAINPDLEKMITILST